MSERRRHATQNRETFRAQALLALGLQRLTGADESAGHITDLVFALGFGEV